MLLALFLGPGRAGGLLLAGLLLAARPALAQPGGEPVQPAAAPAARDLDFFLAQARANSPLSAEVQNQGRAAALETERLRAVYTKLQGTLVANYTATPVLSRDNGRTELRYSVGSSSSYVGYDAALSNGALYQGYAQLTQPLFGQRRFAANARQAQAQAQSQQNLARLSLHDLDKLVADQYILCRQDLDQLGYVREVQALLERQRLLVRKLAQASLLKQSDYTLLTIEVQTQELLLNTFRTAYHRDLLDLNALCGLPDTSEVAVAPAALALRRAGPLPALSGFVERYRLDSLGLTTAQQVFELRYQPALSAVGTGGFNAVALGELPQRLGVSAGLSLNLTLFDGHQRQLSRDRTQVLLATTRAAVRNFAAVNPVRQNRLLYEVRQLGERQRLARAQLASYRQVLDSYKREVIAGQLSVVNYVQVLKNYSAAARDLVLLENNRLLLVNAYNYWTW